MSVAVPVPSLGIGGNACCRVSTKSTPCSSMAFTHRCRYSSRRVYRARSAATDCGCIHSKRSAKTSLRPGGEEVSRRKLAIIDLTKNGKRAMFRTRDSAKLILSPGCRNEKAVLPKVHPSLSDAQRSDRRCPPPSAKPNGKPIFRPSTALGPLLERK